MTVLLHKSRMAIADKLADSGLWLLAAVHVLFALSFLVVLAGLVFVRTFLSISLGVEINGHWPWENTRMERARLDAATDR